MRVGGVWRVEGLCDLICFGFFPRRAREILEIVSKLVYMLMPAFDSNMGVTLYVALCPHSFVSGNIGAHL